MPGGPPQIEIEGIPFVQLRESEGRIPADVLGRLILLVFGDWMEKRRIPFDATLVV